MTEEERSKFIEEGFTQDQVDEIQLGLDAGLAISVYARKEYFAIQMRLIRQGLLDGIDVSLYARPEYDWFQMEEIRKGLLKEIDVSVYADASISYDRMRQIRKGLEQGVDLSRYVKLDAGIIRQIRKSCLAKVNIIDYIKEGYQPEQLEEIRISLERGVVARPYISVEFRGMAIRQICEGLETGLDVSVYADPRYDWRQMQEIRLGLENRLKVSIYANPLYSWKQMLEIRLGLEAGIDVSKYKSFMYTAPEMRKRRLQLQEETWNVEDVPPEEIPQSEKKVFADFELRVSDDEMDAFVVVKHTGMKLSDTDLKQALRQEGICKGIDTKAIELLKQGTAKNAMVKVASGVRPQDGEDGWYEFFFRTDISKTPKILPDGTVDYKSIEWFEMVKQGQKLAVYHEAAEGVNGYSVKGRILHAKHGKEKKILTGKGFTVDADKKTYTAAMNGKIELDGEHLEISRTLVLQDVSSSGGNINFDGSVYITGDVGSNIRIEASEDVVVNGYVEGAIIDSGGSVVLHKGMNGDGTGYIRASKGVIGKFFESAKVYATEDIYADYCMNCELYTEGEILISGTNGSLMGGMSCAVNGITVNNLGNHAGILTQVKIGMNDKIVHQLQNIEGSIVGVNQELKILRNAYSDFMVKYSPEERSTMSMFLKVESAIFTKEAEMEQLMASKMHLEKSIEKMQEANAVIRNNLYEGVLIEINGLRWNSKNVQAVTIRSVNHRIAVYSNS